MSKLPSPGTREAIKIGCLCPVMDNNYGAGIGKDENGDPMFWYNADCPIHGALLTDISPSDKPNQESERCVTVSN